MAAAFSGMNADSVVWEWTNDQGEWSPYEAVVSNFIEDNYASQSNIVHLAGIDRNLSSLAVDLDRMVQVSQYGIERPVRRELYDSDSAVAHGATWQWGGDSSRQRNMHNMWHSYSMEVANMLEVAYNQNRYSGVDLDVNPINQPYFVDLSQMKQINKTTGFSRPVQRLLTGANYRTIASGPRQQQPNSKSQSWQQCLFNFFGAGSGSGSSGFGGAVGSGSSGFGGAVGSGSYGFGSTYQPMPMIASALSLPNTMAATSLPSTGSHSSSGFNFASSSNRPASQMFSFSGSSSGGLVLPPVATSSSTQASGARPKRVRALRRNLTPGFSSDTASSSSLMPSSQSASTSNWTHDMNGPTSSAAQGMSTKAFTTWRDPSNQTGSSNLGKSVHFPLNPPAAAASSSNGVGGGGNSISLFSPVAGFSQLISGLSGMVISTYRYVTTGGNFNQSVSTSVASSVVPAAVPPTLVSNAAKAGARSIGGNYVNTKRLKVSGSQTNSVPQDDLSHVQRLTATDVLASYIKEVKNPPAKEDCCICCDSLREASGYGQGNSYTVVQLVKCSHMFHIDCITAMYDKGDKNGSIQCPSCKTIYGTKYGNCPNGTMEYSVIPNELHGYNGCSTIEIKYNIKSGIQAPQSNDNINRWCRAVVGEGLARSPYTVTVSEEFQTRTLRVTGRAHSPGDVHPNPGRPYKVKGFPRNGYLPNNHEGQKVLSLLITAWRRRLTFTIGTSVTTGEPDVVVWNEIHHKTEMTNKSGHGYPDPNYLSNVMLELAAHGVTDDSQ